MKYIKTAENKKVASPRACVPVCPAYGTPGGPRYPDGTLNMKGDVMSILRVIGCAMVLLAVFACSGWAQEPLILKDYDDLGNLSRVIYFNPENGFREDMTLSYGTGFMSQT